MCSFSYEALLYEKMSYFSLVQSLVRIVMLYVAMPFTLYACIISMWSRHTFSALADI